MRQRGRKAAGSLALVKTLDMPQRLEPPATLGERASAVWRDVVGARPPGWFNGATRPLLMAFCRHTVNAEKIADRLAQLPELKADDPETLDRFERLLKMADREVRAFSSLATALRLTNQSLDKRAAAREATSPERPWK